MLWEVGSEMRSFLQQPLPLPLDSNQLFFLLPSHCSFLFQLSCLSSTTWLRILLRLKLLHRLASMSPDGLYREIALPVILK